MAQGLQPDIATKMYLPCNDLLSAVCSGQYVVDNLFRNPPIERHPFHCLISAVLSYILPKGCLIFWR